MKFPEDVVPKLFGSNAHSDTKDSTTHHGEDSWSMLQESALSLLSIPLMWVSSKRREREEGGVSRLPALEKKGRQILIHSCFWCGCPCREGLCLFPPCLQASLLSSVGECSPGCLWGRARFCSGCQ